MSLETLYRDFNDLNFRTLKVLRLDKVDEHIVKDYISFISKLKSELTNWVEDSIVLEKVHSIVIPEFDFTPKLSFGRKILGFLTFKYSTKRYVTQSRMNYFRNIAKHNKDLTQYISLVINR
jgi:hypothetical protein